MVYSDFIGNYSKLSVNLKKYYDFIDYKVSFIPGINEYNIPSKYFDYIRLVIVDNGFYFDTKPLVDHLFKKYNIDENITPMKIRNYIRMLKFTPTREFFEKHSNIKQLYYEWFEEKKSNYNEEIDIIKDEYYRLTKDKNNIYRKLPCLSGEARVKAKNRLDVIKEKTSLNIRDRISKLYIDNFINDVEREMMYAYTYKNNRYMNIPYVKNIIINKNLLYYYLVNTVYNSSKKEDSNKEQIKDYIQKYIEHNKNQIDKDGNITITYKNYYSKEISKTYNLNELMDYIENKSLSLK